MGFKVKLVGKKIGKIRKQKPVAGTRLVPGATVTLTVGK
jgi:beta-lactam-binding protein with PASTA domain